MTDELFLALELRETIRYNNESVCGTRLIYELIYQLVVATKVMRMSVRGRSRQDRLGALLSAESLYAGLADRPACVT